MEPCFLKAGYVRLKFIKDVIDAEGVRLQAFYVKTYNVYGGESLRLSSSKKSFWRLQVALACGRRLMGSLATGLVVVSTN